MGILLQLAIDHPGNVEFSKTSKYSQRVNERALANALSMWTVT